MRSASSRQTSYLDRPSLPSRIAAFLLAIGVSLLIVFMLLTLGALPPHITDTGLKLITLRLEPEAGSAPKQEQAVAKPKRAKPVVPPLPPPIIPKLNMLVLSKEEFAATDIAKLSPHPAEASENAGAGQGSGSAEGAGEGPGGEKLYNAEWYREPSKAEMATYMPAGQSEDAWAMIACKTIERYRVEDCQELAESPPGSGLSRALRLASWQFLVRPPRIGGRPMVGAWVRIRFDFTHEKK
jgi:protein TonB